jgi:hypothetical protein
MFQPGTRHRGTTDVLRSYLEHGEGGAEIIAAELATFRVPTWNTHKKKPLQA